MKTIIVAAVFAASLITRAFAFNPETVDEKVSRKFNKDYKDAVAVTWKITDEFSEARYLLNGVTMETFYSPDGDWLATTRPISLEEQPAKALQTAKDKYKGYVIVQSISVDLPYGKKGYYVSMAGEDRTVMLELSPRGWKRVLKIEY
jgi:hypothetical protein